VAWKRFSRNENIGTHTRVTGKCTHQINELICLTGIVKAFLQCTKYNPQQKNSSSKAFIEHLLKSGTICDIQNPKLVFQNELENCDILNMQSSQLFEEP